MTGGTLYGRIDSSTSSVEVESDSLDRQVIDGEQNGKPQLRNRSLVQQEATIPAPERQKSTDVNITRDKGLEGFHTGSAASEIEPGKFQETRLLTSHEALQRMYAALQRAELRQQLLREQETRYTEEADE